MKKITLLLLAVLVLAACSPQDNARSNARRDLQAAIEEANKLMKGKRVDYCTTVEKCEFKDDNVHYYYIIDENHIDMDLFEGIKEEVKAAAYETFAKAPDAEEVFKLLEIINGDIILHYKGDQSGKTVTIELGI